MSFAIIDSLHDKIMLLEAKIDLKDDYIKSLEKEISRLNEEINKV